MAVNSETIKLSRKLRKEGWTVTMNGRCHWEAVHPVTGIKVTFANSPSDRRWKVQAESDIRRAEKGIASRGASRCAPGIFGTEKDAAPLPDKE